MLARLPHRSLALTLLALALGGCAGGAGGSADETPTGPVLVSRSVSGTTSESALRERQRQWQALGVRDYSFVLTLGCFCEPSITQPTRVEVRDGRVVSATAVASGAAQPVERFPSIDELFERALAAAAAGEHLEAAHDEQYGWPTRLVIGTIANDAGIIYEVQDVRRQE